MAAKMSAARSGRKIAADTKTEASINAIRRVRSLWTTHVSKIEKVILVVRLRTSALAG